MFINKNNMLDNYTYLDKNRDKVIYSDPIHNPPTMKWKGKKNK